MRKEQTAQYDMLLRLTSVLIRFSSAWTNLRLFASQVTQLQESLKRIKTLTKDQELLRAGVRPERDQYRDLLVDAVLVTAGQIQALATVNKDAKLRTRFALSRTKLIASMLELGGIAREVHSVATENLEALAELGTTNESLDNLDDLITTYDGLAGAPRDAIKNRSTITRILARELRGSVELARTFFDPMMRQFESTQSDFFEAYQSARGSFKPGSRAKLDENGQPVAKWRIAQAAKKEANATAKTKPKAKSSSKRSTAERNTNATANSEKAPAAETVPLAS